MLIVFVHLAECTKGDKKLQQLYKKTVFSIDSEFIAKYNVDIE